MSKSQGFQFKQFFIAHDKCAMKVNTDGILLGASADVTGVEQILDLGTGTGLVAVMLAQRTAETTQITALELEPNAYQQAVENCQNSVFSDRLHVCQGDVLQHHFEKKFDLIVSNPPYFTDSLASRSQARDLARAATQSHLAWLLQAKQWLSEQGEITFILPFDTAEKLRVQSQTSGLFCTKICKIITKKGQQPKRMIVSFSLRNVPLQVQKLVIYNSEYQYTEAFKQLTKAFYLNM
ncbi:type 12 methyltransferase [Actinobacillus ureae]|uniref:tRNA1(Val) (adenine(37)-N6)-methyltransferase n=1 Tax=Actinobacillus ureae TaxID=723 RepID=UPI000E157BF1|nr:methyltransferase [Actinobacillus ureae]SUT87272.1 type 12 methyltransferase [Actinobacillus ureae]SUU48446.1 type 12 methyltransferase [Actinobacillus ureae]